MTQMPHHPINKLTKVKFQRKKILILRSAGYGTICFFVISFLGHVWHLGDITLGDVVH